MKLTGNNIVWFSLLLVTCLGLVASSTTNNSNDKAKVTVDDSSDSNSNSSSVSNNNSNSSPSKSDKDSPSSTKSGSSSQPSSSSKIRIPSNAARGLITMLEPPVAQNFIAGWAIGTVAKLKWKYDNNLKIKPDNISIIALRQDGGTIVTYNIALELPSDTFDYDWDTGNFSSDVNNPPLVESENYKMYIFDTARSYLAGAPAGGLNPFTRPFRLYKSSDGGSNICLKCLSDSSMIMPSRSFSVLLPALLTFLFYFTHI